MDQTMNACAGARGLARIAAKGVAYAALIGLAAAACRSTSGPVPNAYAAIVYGLVSNGAGQPLQGVQVQSETYRETCATGQRTGSSSPTLATTDAAGMFYQQILSGSSSPSQCLRVIVRQQDGTTRVGAEVTGLRLKLAAEASLPYDSLRTNVTIP